MLISLPGCCAAGAEGGLICVSVSLLLTIFVRPVTSNSTGPIFTTFAGFDGRR